MSDFGSWLTATRKAMGFPTSSSLARKIGIPQPTISRWQSGAKPSVEHLVKISDLFGIDLKTLLILSGHMQGDTEGVTDPPEGLVFVSLDDLQAVLQPAAGQDLLKLTDAVLRLREACGLDEPDDAEEIVHDLKGYRRGCRCSECREANRVFMKAQKADRVARGRENPSLIPHGTSGYLNWDCRCQKCTWAGSVSNRKVRERRKQRQGEDK